MSPRAEVRAVLAVATVGGAATMTVELAAVRLLAPWFGTSQVVWTNVIAVVLLALSTGYLLGGRLAARGRPLAWLGGALLLAGVATAWLPALSAPAARAFLPADVALHEAAGLVVWGSLAASLLLFFPPALVLGTVAPLAVEAVQERRGGHAGQAGGFVLSVSTLGSLAGVFGTSHVLVPRLGLTGTFLLAASALVVAGVAGLALARASRGVVAAAALALLGWGGALAGSRSARPLEQPGLEELAYVESSYQSIRVVEADEAHGQGTPLRMLQVNESFDSYQSVWQPELGLLPRGYYYNDFALPPAWAAAEAPDVARPWRVLVLGLGAGTAVRVLEGALPTGMELEATGVELDPAVVELAREHFDLDPPGETRRWVAGLDARVALRSAEGPFDQILLDCYANQVEIPPHLCTRELFTEVRARLADGGWLSVNLGGFGFDDPVVEAVARTCAAAFESEVLLLRVPASRNVSLVARRAGPLPVGEDGVLSAAAGPAAELLGPRALPGAWRVVSAGSEDAPLTDDRCPIEPLQRRSIREGLARLRGEGAG